MAANKRKILENARKLAQKGAKDKALKEYQKLVQLDPRDAKLRLEIGDAHRRWGQVDKAIDTYTKVADQYMKEGFDARAVAVYKQILNLNPERNESYEPLAELYERMGLTAEAINALQTAADGYHREGKKREALELLRKMATIDPTNTTSRIKVAELLRQEEMIAEALLEYDEVAAELARQGDEEAEGNVYKRILELDSNRAPTLCAFAKNLLARNMPAEAESVAKRALSADDQEPASYELLADVYRVQGKEDLLPEVYRPLAEVYRQRGDEDRARDIQQRFVTGSELEIEADGLDSGARFVEERQAPGDASAALEPEDELSLDHAFGEEGEEMELGPELELDPGDDALDLGTPLEPPDEIPLASDGVDQSLELTISDATGGPAPQGDPDQLMAEASVYLRYGKRERAIDHLEAILQQEPEHRSALEKLGEAFAEDGDSERAVEHWLLAAKRATEEADDSAVAVLRGRIEALDPDAAATISPVQADAPPEPDPDLEADLEGDLGADLELEIDEPEVADDLDDVSNDDASSDDLDDDIDDDIDIDVDLDDDEEEAEEELFQEEPEAAPVEPAPEPPKVAAKAPPAEPSHSSASLSTTTAQQILEDLEEADFYMDQGLLDEADEIYKRVLAIAPNHPRALVRLGEVAAARGEDPGALTGSGRTAAAAASEAPAEADAESEVEAGADSDLDTDAEIEEPEVEVPAIDPDEGLDVPEEDPLDLSGEMSAQDEVDPVDADTGVDMSAEEDEAPLDEPLDEVVDEPADETVEEPIDEPLEEAAAETADATEEAPTEDVTGEFSVPTETSPSEPEAAPGEGFDLAAELSDVFDDDDENGRSISGEASEDDGFAAVFDAFKRGVSETLSEADHEAHYDLGIAYKEMGLFDDAIQEFRAAMVHPPRVVECLHLIALCAFDGGQLPLAVEHLEQLLESEAANDDQRLAARYDLGRAHEALEAYPKARVAFESVLDVDPNYLDAAEHLAGLPAAKPEAPAAAEDDEGGFESFEDVISEVGEEAAESAEDPAGESFHDLVAEANAEPEPVPEREPEPEPEPEPAPKAKKAASTPGAKKKKRKKKISFL